ncbi:hypothetical protein ELG88_09765 [Rhizobium leguminosarum]|uniref:hypothetical protein n=1 Tax=Rhizobium leguminosarum TaxID=384 RepID=UPI001030D6F3|nr:hypothetical protein [Rhizobium leguminosarum]TAY66545.1 hypothetical protein ELH82_10290 [Rhizobium leguminosarum]TBF35472.1 hypothetical protein ELG88_09765 [Rhizobium leguminosarum]
MSNVKNLAEVPVTIGGTTIQPGTTVNFHRWLVLQHSDSAHALLAAKLIEVIDEEAPKAASKKKSTTDGV